MADSTHVPESRLIRPSNKSKLAGESTMNQPESSLSQSGYLPQRPYVSPSHSEQANVPLLQHQEFLPTEPDYMMMDTAMQSQHHESFDNSSTPQQFLPTAFGCHGTHRTPMMPGFQQSSHPQDSSLTPTPWLQGAGQNMYQYPMYPHQEELGQRSHQIPAADHATLDTEDVEAFNFDQPGKRLPQ